MKKIRVTVSEDTWSLFQKDSEEFGINNNKLCNYLLDKLKYNKKIEFEKELERENKNLSKIIQFDLNVANQNIYFDILRENKVDTEAEFFRELFEIYTSKFKYQRELFIFNERVSKILDGIKKNRKLKISYLNQVYTVSPYFLKREEQGDENFLFAYNENDKRYQNIKLKEMEVLSILDEDIEKYDKKFVENIRENFDPFLDDKINIKVRLTPEGEMLLKSLTNYRPHFVKKDGHNFYFHSSPENAKLYFGSFYNEAEILEPKELREAMRKNAKNLLELYKS
ncbi:MAG: WYL domain-containing protein [Fusobacteriaceae bacterium]